MFTGIVTCTGKIIALLEKGGDLELGIDAGGLSLERLAIGDSVCVQGACLTVTRLDGKAFFADVSRETLMRTTLGGLERGSRVNLEPSLRAGDALGGHMVSGHVDAIGKLIDLRQDARSSRMEFELPAALMRFVAPKGSICIDGVSLTVNGVSARRFDVNIIPHTQAATTLGSLEVDAVANIEIDLIARYLERLINQPRE